MVNIIENVKTLKTRLPESSRDYAYALASAVVLFCSAFGLVDNEQAALWTSLAVACVTLLYAAFYSPSQIRATFYTIVGPLGAILMAYGLIGDARWAIITAAVGQALGITTAATASGRPIIIGDPATAAMFASSADARLETQRA